MASGTSGTRARTLARRRLPAQLTEARVRTICAKVAQGVPQTAAAGSVGIPRRTLQNWLAKGREPDAPEPYASFADRLQESIDRFHESRVQLLHHVGNDDPKVIQWELERRFKDDWGDPERPGGDKHLHIHLAAERDALTERLLEALAGYPDALTHALSVLGGNIVAGNAIEIGDEVAA